MSSQPTVTVLDSALHGLQPVERNEYTAFLRDLGKDNVECRIDTDRHHVVTEYTRDQIVVACSVCRRTPLGRIVDIRYGILMHSSSA